MEAKERPLGERNRAFARRIAARARPLAPTTTERHAVPTWIQRARQDAARLEARTIRPTAWPIATLRLARPATTERAVPAPDLVLARPSGPPPQQEPTTEAPPPFWQAAPQPAPPFRVADVRERLAQRVEATRPTSTQQPPSVVRRAISRVEEESREQVGARQAVPSDVAPDETGAPPAAPTDRTTMVDMEPLPVVARHTGAILGEPTEAVSRVPEPTPSPRRAVSRLVEGPIQQQPVAEIPQVEADRTAMQAPAGGKKQAAPAPLTPEPGTAPPLVETPPTAPTDRTNTADTERLPVEARHAGAIHGVPTEAVSRVAEPTPSPREPADKPPPPTGQQTVKGGEQPADADTAPVGARHAVAIHGEPTEAVSRVAEPTPSPRKPADKPPPPPTKQQTLEGKERPTDVGAAPSPAAPAEERAPEARRLPHQAVPLEQALFGEAAAVETPPQTAQPPTDTLSPAPTKMSEPAPSVRRMVLQPPPGEQAAAPPSPSPAAIVRRALAAAPTPAAPFRPEAMVRPRPEPETVSAPAPTPALPATAATEAQPQPTAQPDVQEIAERVWALIRDRVRVERERLGRP